MLCPAIEMIWHVKTTKAHFRPTDMHPHNCAKSNPWKKEREPCKQWQPLFKLFELVKVPRQCHVQTNFKGMLHPAILLNVLNQNIRTPWLLISLYWFEGHVQSCDDASHTQITACADSFKSLLFLCQNCTTATTYHSSTREHVQSCDDASHTRA